MFDVKKEYPEAPLHRAEFEHDNCGIGAEAAEKVLDIAISN